MRPVCFPALAAGLLFLLPGALRADTTPPGSTPAPIAYQIQPIVKQGDTVGGITIRKNADFEIGAFNDQGQLAFVTENQAGGEALLQYAGGQFTAIAAASQDAPNGTWPSTLGFWSPVSMNQSGQVLFFAGHGSAAPSTWDGLYLWDPGARKTTSVLRKGMPLGPDLTALDMNRPAGINNRGDIALAATVKDTAGTEEKGVFFLDRDGQVQTVALPGQALSGGSKLGQATVNSINDAGVVAFEAAAQGSNASGAYLWENGTITPVVTVGSREPGGKLFTNILSPQVNNRDRSVFLIARTGDRLGSNDYRSPLTGIYRVAHGQCYPVAVQGQEMPGGGKIRGFPGWVGVAAPGGRAPWLSAPNEAGQIAFVALLDDGTAGAYLADAEGKLSLILKDKATTDLGKVTVWGSGISLNSQGQVALPVRINGGPLTIALLTPVTSPGSGNEEGATP